MGENERFVEMKVVDDVFIRWRQQIFERMEAVVVVPADEDLYRGGNFTDPRDTFSGDGVPFIRIDGVCYFIQQFEA